MINEPLDFDEYEKYSIDPRNSAIKFTYFNISIERANEIEEELQDQMFKVVNIDLSSGNEGKFNLIVIALKPITFTF